MCLCVYSVHAHDHVFKNAHGSTHIHTHTHTDTHSERKRCLTRFAPHQTEKFVIPSTQYASSFGNQPGGPLLICPLLDPN